MHRQPDPPPPPPPPAPPPAAAAGAAAAYSGGGSLPEYANHVDPAPAALRAEKWRNKNTELSEEEMEAVMVRSPRGRPLACYC